MSNSPTHISWMAMNQRCNDKNHDNYKYYGGRGIKVCKRWNHFINFYIDMGERPEGYSLERIDVEKDYSPDNCKWVSHKEQCNNRRSSRFIEFNGETRTLQQWAEFTGITRNTIEKRIDNYGWSVEKALTTPTRGKQ